MIRQLGFGPVLDRVLLLSVVVAGVAGAVTAAMGPLVLAGAAAAGFVGALSLWPYLWVPSMAVAVSTPRLFVDFGGITVNAERVVLPLCALFVLAAILARRIHLGRNVSITQLAVPLAGLLLYAGSGAVGSITSGHRSTEGVRLAVLWLTVASPLMLVPLLATTTRATRVAYASLVVASGASAIVGLASLILYQSGATDVGVQRDWLTGAASPFGLQWEGNTFGSQSGAALMLTIPLVVAPYSRNSRLLLAGTCLLLAIAMIASLSRGAWVGAVAGFAVIVVLSNWSPRRWLSIAVVLAVAVPAAVVWLGSETSLPFGVRLASLVTLAQGEVDGTTLLRSLAIQAALESFPSNWLLGAGPGGLTPYIGLSAAEGPSWISNLVVRALYETGVLGFGGLLVAMGAPLLAAVRAIRRSGRPAPTLVGSVGAGASLLVAFQATDATWLAYPWFFLGLTSALHNAAHEPPPTPGR